MFESLCPRCFPGMACENNKAVLVLPIIVLALICTQHYYHCCVNGEPQVPCLFIFGDSLSDSGNNNNLATSAKSNFSPYGIDFPVGPTGRFTNGRTEVDIITEYLGFEHYIPPFANINGSDILKGVNYASGAGGILLQSGTNLGAVISLGAQIGNHRVIVSRIASRLGSIEEARKYLSKCIYYVNIGSNDYINNYFQPHFFPTSLIYSPQQYAQVLVDDLYLNLQELIDVGARKFVMVGLGLLGCTPNAMKTHGTTGGSCFDEENAASFIFDESLKSLVDSLNSNSSSSSNKFIFINSTAVALANSNAPGFRVSTSGCCRTGLTGECVAGGLACSDRREYVFWDDFHPTQAWNLINANAAFNSSNPAFAFPMDINTLVHLMIQEQESEIMVNHHFKSYSRLISTASQ